MNNVCVYCNKNNSSTSFNSKEHVIPRLFGVFDKNINNLTIKNLVCDNCNSKFSKIETYVKEDTEEGIFFQMLNLSNSYYVRIRGEKVKTNFCPGLGDDFFNETFPFFKIENSKQVIDFKSQIKLIRPSGYHYIFIVDNLKKILDDKKEVSKIRRIFDSVENKNIRIFAGADHANDESQLEEAIEILNSLRTEKYREGKRKHVPMDNAEGELFKINMDCTIDRDRARILAKIVFNYFIFCAKSTEMEDMTYKQNFQKIRKFINGDKNVPIKDIITNIDFEDYILFEEKQSGGRFTAHQIVFYQESNNIVSELILLGRKIYKIMIGEIPKELARVEFGCGHLFSPMDRTVHNLTQNPAKIGVTSEPEFGLFKRI